MLDWCEEDKEREDSVLCKDESDDSEDDMEIRVVSEVVVLRSLSP
jgi:hypothetical protein